METPTLNLAYDELQARYSDEYVVHHTVVPQVPEDVPKIVGWSGPARSGTTALLYFMAAHPRVDRAYFQPQKTLFRKGGPDFFLSELDKTVCMKEVFGGDGVTRDQHDPVDLLLRAGVPLDKVHWIIILRDPTQAFKSLFHRVPSIDVESYIHAQNWSLELFAKYKKMGVRVTPFVYELTQCNESEVLTKLLNKVGLEKKGKGLEFADAVNDKIIPGQSSDDAYFDQNIRATVDKRRFIYSLNSYAAPVELIERIELSCRAQYEQFKSIAEQEFGVR